MDNEHRNWAQCDTSKLPEELRSRAEEYWTFLEQSGRLQIWRRALRAYYGFDPEGLGSHASRITEWGEAGEILKTHVNHFRSLVQHVLVMATGDRPSPQARALNDSYESMRQVELAEKLVDYFFDEKKVDDDNVIATEAALVLGEGWVLATWDHSKGEAAQVKEVPIYEEGSEEPVRWEKQVVYEGDVETRALTPLEIIRDPRMKPRDTSWVVLPLQKNRWDLAAQYPEKREEILNADQHKSSDVGDLFDPWIDWTDYGESVGGDKDQVTVYALYHEKTQSMPDGRHAMTVGDVVLFDGPMPYQDVPVRSIVPQLELGGTFGYSPFWDLVGLQEALDSTMSAAVTVHDTYSLPNYRAPKGSDVEVEDLAGTGRLLEYNPTIDGGFPELMEQPEIRESTFALHDRLVETMQTLSGVNSVARGNPEASLRSGAALALVHAMALKYNSATQREVVRLREGVATHIMRLVQSFADTPRMAEIAGPNSRPQMIQFKKDMIRDVKRVVFDLGNPLMRTTAGKVQIADSLMERGLIQDAQAYITTLTTGRPEPITHRAKTAELNLTQENERLQQGQQVPVMVTDHHAQHIDSHLAVLDNPSVRENPELHGPVMEHIQHHLDQWMHASMTNPSILLATGQKPLPPPPPPGMPPGAAQGPEGGQGPQGGPQGPKPEGGTGDPNQAEVPGVTDVPGNGPLQQKMPQMPKNPLTGQPMDDGA